MKIGYIILPFLLCSCSMGSSTKPSLEFSKPKLNLAAPESITLSKVKFKVLHKDNAEEYFNSSQSNTVFALTETDYKNLSINMLKIKSYIKIQKKQLELYKNYYEGENNGKDTKIQESKKY